MNKRKSRNDETDRIASLLDAIGDMTDTFCRKYLDEEYALVCRDLAEDLAVAAPCPLLRGKPLTWAAGIVYTAGWINFLTDPSFPPFMTTKDLAQKIGVSTATMSAKKRIIEETLDLIPLDPDYTVDSRMEENPLAWMIDVNGLLMDARTAPREIQEAAFAQGVIPYIPDDEENAAPQTDESPTIIQFPGTEARSYEGGDSQRLDQKPR